MACDQPGSHSSTVINVMAGDKIGVFWGHIIGGAQYPNDLAIYIDPSHKGPIMYYVAKVNDAATASKAGWKWFKIYKEGFDTSRVKWTVDDMILNAGWSYITLPTCIAPGQYLLRVELLALHSAYDLNGAQFCQSCANSIWIAQGRYRRRRLCRSLPVSAERSEHPDPDLVNGKDDNGRKP